MNDEEIVSISTQIVSELFHLIVTIMEIFGAVESDALLCHGLRQVFDGLSLAGRRLAADEAAPVEVEGHQEDPVATFGQRGHHQSGVRSSGVKGNDLIEFD